MNPLLFEGLESLIQGIIAPVVISFGASIVRAALFGWHGFRHYVSNLTVGIFGGVIAHWMLTRFDLDPTIDASIVAFASLISKDALAAFLSRRSLAHIGDAMRKRACHEILHRGAPRRTSEEE